MQDKKNDKNYIELTKNQEEDDDIQVESVEHKEPQPRKTNKKENNEINNLDLDEISDRIKNFDPIEIKDFINRPFKTIGIVFLLLFSGILFITVGTYKFLDNQTYDHYLPYNVLGTLLLIPGVYYTFILINVWLGREGYDYDLVPDLNE